MKKSFITLVGILSLATTLPAVAGPDMQQLEQGRKTKHARMQQLAQQQSKSQPDMQARMEKMEQMMKSCSEMMKQSS